MFEEVRFEAGMVAGMFLAWGLMKFRSWFLARYGEESRARMAQAMDDHPPNVPRKVGFERWVVYGEPYLTKKPITEQSVGQAMSLPYEDAIDPLFVDKTAVPPKPVIIHEWDSRKTKGYEE